MNSQNEMILICGGLGRFLTRIDEVFCQKRRQRSTTHVVVVEGVKPAVFNTQLFLTYVIGKNGGVGVDSLSGSGGTQLE